ncbi:BBF_collapsed_G0046700.mRNA.1.CDS.1 [Saccharomyces cerevisiae]|nr:BBF_collapsed_G0046700.mRNA.1.CDS.1 [Saccharomyces cerevisiae]
MSLIIDQQENSKSGKRKPNIILDEDDTNDGIERYSDKYLKKRKIGISIDDHPYNLNLFPNELYNVMGINKKKLLAISKFNNADDVFTGTGLQDENIGLSMLAKLKELAEDYYNNSMFLLSLAEPWRWSFLVGDIEFFLELKLEFEVVGRGGSFGEFRPDG